MSEQDILKPLEGLITQWRWDSLSAEISGPAQWAKDNCAYELEKVRAQLAKELSEHERLARLDEAKWWLHYYELNSGYRCLPHDAGAGRVAALERL